jgi:hypothetical protein
MHFRSAVASVLVCTMISLGMPRSAHAEEEAPEASEVDEATTATALSFVKPSPIDLYSPLIAMSAETLARSPSTFAAFSPKPSEILSDNAKTAIIITAIVCGTLILVGVFVIGKPFKH